MDLKRLARGAAARAFVTVAAVVIPTSAVAIAALVVPTSAIAAAALVIADRANSLPEGVEIAAESIDSGAAKDKIEAVARATQEAA